MAPLLGMDGVVLDLERLGLALRIVRDDELHRMQHGHDTLGIVVQVFTQAMLQKCVFDGVGRLGNADALAEVADGGAT